MKCSIFHFHVAGAKRLEETETDNENKRAETDIGIISFVTLGVFLIYAILGNDLMRFVKNRDISVIPRLLLNAAAVLCVDRIVDLGSVDKSLQGLPVKSKGTTTKISDY